MWGTLHIIPASDTRTPPFMPGHKSRHTLEILDAPPRIETLELAVGAVRGQMELVSSFDTILHGGEETPCLVFRRRDAQKQNAWANLLWLQCLVRRHGFADAQHPPHLLGPVVIVWGCEDFMQALTISLAEITQRAH